ncbi:sensor histidine kinase [Streptomyces sp. NPDC058049]|uniref:sensor histidine kinase n=1 Tax=Streptomyces sp. NPDC058049 TaxID=3346314 RepID=UPI0036ECDDCF
MSATPPLPLLKRLSPEAWAALTWCAATAYSILVHVRLPGERQDTTGSGSSPLRYLLVIATATAMALLACALMRHRPLSALALLLGGSVAASTTVTLVDIPLAQFVAFDVALGWITATRPRSTGRAAAGWTLGMMACYLLTRLLLGASLGASAVLVMVLPAVVAWLIGRSVREDRQHAQALRTQLTTQAVTAERLRIARELHDMVAHSIGIIALQAGAASRVMETQPTMAHAALQTIEAAARETLSGLRRMLGALRQAEPGQQAEAVPLDPAPGLADIDRLAERTTKAGVRVDVRRQGERRQLPPEIDMSAYRIIQEAVTNVVRHTGATSCQVSIDCQDSELSIEVLDSGPSRSSSSGSGYGLVGMRERVGLLHGDFRAEPRPEGGFRVAARLPVPSGIS